ncbi:hypothetical protein BHM03_00058759 [Ensete ventricosum]|nr:hypothetical protein BHM03_00058759 [Ensete ventricosum]
MRASSNGDAVSRGGEEKVAGDWEEKRLWKGAVAGALGIGDWEEDVAAGKREMTGMAGSDEEEGRKATVRADNNDDTTSRGGDGLQWQDGNSRRSAVSSDGKGLRMVGAAEEGRKISGRL